MSAKLEGRDERAIHMKPTTVDEVAEMIKDALNLVELEINERSSAVAVALSLLLARVEALEKARGADVDS